MLRDLGIVPRNMEVTVEHCRDEDDWPGDFEEDEIDFNRSH